MGNTLSDKAPSFLYRIDLLSSRCSCGVGKEGVWGNLRRGRRSWFPQCRAKPDRRYGRAKRGPIFVFMIGNLLKRILKGSGCGLSIKRWSAFVSRCDLSKAWRAHGHDGGDQSRERATRFHGLNLVSGVENVVSVTPRHVSANQIFNCSSWTSRPTGQDVRAWLRKRGFPPSLI